MMNDFNAEQLQALHTRIMKAQLPGYTVNFSDGPNSFCMCIDDHNGKSHYSRDHSWSLLMEWADETLSSIGA